MKKTKKVLQCDVCGKEVDDGGENWIGGHPSSGWFHLTETGGGTTLEALQRQREWDICSRVCLLDFTTKMSVKNT